MDNVMILIKSVLYLLNQNHNYYQVFLEKKGIMYKCCIRKELISLKVLMLIRKIHLWTVLFVTIGIFQTKCLIFAPIVCNGYHHVLMMSSDINSFTILNN